MPLKPNATANIVIGGLALCHYNPHTDLWEVLFIRDDENLHNLKMMIDYGEPHAREIPINFGDEITIKVKNPKSRSDSYEPSPNFKREIGVDDKHDLRWILDFSSAEMHDHAVTVKKRKRDNFLTVPNAVFYTSKWSTKKYDLQKKKDGADDGNPRPLSAIGEYAGADIDCHQGGGVSIEIRKSDGKADNYDLKAKTTVFFNNLCDETNPRCASDFPHYYDVISDHGKTFDLISQPLATPEMGIRGERYMCEVAIGTKILPEPPGTLNNGGN